ncbi:MAG: DUF5990 family protein [Pseudolysinimonas sp.]
MTEISVQIRAVGIPVEWCRLNGVRHLGISSRTDVVDLVSTERATAEFSATVEVVEKATGRDFRGPYVFGRVGERFLYLNWGSRSAHGWATGKGGRVKLQLGFVGPIDLEAALSGSTLIADLVLGTPKGTPVFATVRAPVLTWRASDGLR